jgi:hypothetical protein
LRPPAKGGEKADLSLKGYLVERFVIRRRSRISLLEIPPFVFCFSRERSIKARNLGFLLREIHLFVVAGFSLRRKPLILDFEL